MSFLAVFHVNHDDSSLVFTKEFFVGEVTERWTSLGFSESALIVNTYEYHQLVAVVKLSDGRTNMRPIPDNEMWTCQWLSLTQYWSAIDRDNIPTEPFTMKLNIYSFVSENGLWSEPGHRRTICLSNELGVAITLGHDGKSNVREGYYWNHTKQSPNANMNVFILAVLQEKAYQISCGDTPELAQPNDGKACLMVVTDRKEGIGLDAHYFKVWEEGDELNNKTHTH